MSDEFLRLLVEATGVPLYRSAEYDALPEGDPRRLASMRRAADLWWADGQPEAIAERLDQEDREVRARLRAMSGDLSDATDWQTVAAEPTHAELIQRRRELPRAS